MEFELPLYDLKIKQDQNVFTVFDPVRKKYIETTPEELVRQNWIEYLTSEREFSINHMSVEKEIRFNGKPKRFDLMVVDQQGHPLMLCEFKAPHISIGQKTFDQLAVYNSVLGAKYLLVSNGRSHYLACRNDGEKSWHFLKNMPLYFDLLA